MHIHIPARKSTHSHSIMLLSHSPWSHFSQSPGVCEGQSGLSSHKPRLHTRLPVKVCVSTKCNTARRNRNRGGGGDGKNPDDPATQCGAGPYHTASGSSCLTLMEITVYLEIRIGDWLLKEHAITGEISRLRSLQPHNTEWPQYNRGVARDVYQGQLFSIKLTFWPALCLGNSFEF